MVHSHKFWTDERGTLENCYMVRLANPNGPITQLKCYELCTELADRGYLLHDCMYRADFILVSLTRSLSHEHEEELRRVFSFEEDKDHEVAAGLLFASMA